MSEGMSRKQHRNSETTGDRSTSGNVGGVCKTGSVRRFLIVILTFGILTIFLLLYLKPSNNWRYIPLSAVNLKIPFSQQTEQENNKILLIWFWPWGIPFSLDSCKLRFNIDGCKLTSDRNLYSKSQAVIIHHWDIHEDLSNLPKQPRPLYQKWIWWNVESPTISTKKKRLGEVFNLTLTYRRDSDIPVPYGSLIVDPDPSDFKIPNKTKLVFWIVSHWKPSLARVKYYNELIKYIDVSVHGHAFGERLNEKDYEPLITCCKFYLSFENAIHVDYVTEKLYRPLLLGSVPVVLGPPRENYQAFVPGESFIDVNDFSSPKELADYLHHLDEDPVKYKKYFKWRKFYNIQRRDYCTEVCAACEHVKRNNNYRCARNLEKWFWG